MYLDNLICHWDLSIPNCPNLAPHTYGLNNATGRNIDFSNIVDGIAGGKATRFNGVDESIGTSFNGTDLDVITFSIFFRTFDITKSQQYLVDNSPSTSGFGIRLATDNIVFFVFSGGATGLVQATGVITEGFFHHLVCVHCLDRNIIFLDGKFKAETLYDASSGIDDPDDPMEIGSTYNFDSRYYLNGELDEMMIFNSDLTEIQSMDLKQQILMGKY